MTAESAGFGNAAYASHVYFNSSVTVINNNSALNVASGVNAPVVYLGASSGSSPVTVLLGGMDSQGLAGGITMNPRLFYNTIYVQDTTGGQLTVGGQNTSGVNSWGCNFTLGTTANTGKSLTLVAAAGGEVDFTGIISTNGTDTSAGITVGDASHGGVVKITGVNTYAGGTVVNGGTLALSSALTGTTATGNLTVNDGGALAVTVSGTSQLMPSMLTLGNSSGATNNFVAVSSTSTAPILATNLVLYGATIINIQSGTFQTGQTYPLIAYENPEGGGGSVVLGTLPPLVQGYVNDSGSVISLVVTNMTPEIWSGAASGTWDTNDQNWKTNGTSTVYLDGGSVQFDDTATGTTSITNIASVSPSSVIVTNSGKTYSFTGGSIGGTAALTKTGNGLLILANTNTYVGGTVINNGTLQLGDASANNGVVAGGITDNANLTIANPLAQTFANVVSGSGNLIKTSSGALTISGANSFSGFTAIKQGTVSFSTVNNLSTNTMVLGDAATGADTTLQLTAAANVPNNLTVASGVGGRTLSYVGGSTFSGTMALSNNVIAIVTGSGDSYLSGSFTGYGNVTVSNTTANIAWLNGSSTNWTGAFIIQAGTVRPGTSGNQFNTNTVLSISSSNSAFLNFGGINANLYFAGVNDIAGATGGNFGGGSSARNLVLGGVGNYTYSGAFSSAVWGLNITMGATGQQTLTGMNTYAGATTVNSGSLWINGSGSVSSAVYVNGGALGGTGTVSNSVTVNSGGTLSPGASGSGTLTVNNNLTLNAGSTSTFAVNGSTLAKTAIAVGGSATYGGVLNIVPTGSFSNGQTFTLFSGNGSTNASNFASIIGSPGSGLAFSFTNGWLSVVTASAGSAALITNSISGNTLTLTWPSGQSWTLQAQTNNLSTGLSPTGWSAVSGVADGSYSITIDPTKPTVFYRLAK